MSGWASGIHNNERMSAAAGMLFKMSVRTSRSAAVQVSTDSPATCVPDA